MMRWLQWLGKMAKVLALCGTVAWLVLLTSSPELPDAAHPVRYSHRHDVRYVSEQTERVLRILLGSTFALVLVAVGCHFATRGLRERM